MAERCVRCGISEEKVRLFDAIYDGRAEAICERCSIIENVSIIKEPDQERIRESERGGAEVFLKPATNGTGVS